MANEIAQLAVILGLAILNVFGAWYLNRLWNKEKSRGRENSSFGRPH